MLHRERLRTVCENMKQYGLPQILVSDDGALQYLLGRRVEAMERCGMLLIRQEGTVDAYMNRLFCFSAEDGITLHEYRDGEDPYALIAARLSPGILGVDDALPSRQLLELLSRRPDIRPVRGSAPVASARACKEPSEQEMLARAGAVNDKSIAFGISSISASLTERELAQKIDDFFISNGGKQVGQYQVVCYGANAAQPHHVPDHTLLREGNAVLLDLVCPINGYWCDMTRTVFYQTVTDRHRALYELVRRAQQAGIDAVRPGVKLCDIDRAARQVIEAAGYGDAFFTRLGHGIGTSVHEPPNVSADSDVVAREGMVFSIEPGIYLENDVGIRIEDLVIVTEDGCRVLTSYPKELQIVG